MNSHQRRVFKRATRSLRNEFRGHLLVLESKLEAHVVILRHLATGFGIALVCIAVKLWVG